MGKGGVVAGTEIRCCLAITGRVAPSSHGPCTLYGRLRVRIVGGYRLRGSTCFIYRKKLGLVFIGSYVGGQRQEGFIATRRVKRCFLRRSGLCYYGGVSRVGLSSGVGIGDPSRRCRTGAFTSRCILPASLLRRGLPGHRVRFDSVFAVTGRFSISIALATVGSVRYSGARSRDLLYCRGGQLG